MTIVRPSSGPGFYGDEDGERRWWDGAAWSTSVQTEAVPRALREERLARQVESFARAGYRLETSAELQAVMVRERTRRLLPRLARGRGVAHRVVITVDRGGAVRFA